MANKNYYFSSDYHLGHVNILKYDNRPFSSIGAHDKTIIENHNRIVKASDDFYFLGDFCFNKTKAEEYLSQLNGNLFFIKGNHDYYETIALYKKYGTYLGGLEEIKIAGQHIVLCHYPILVWNRSHHGSWHLYGHCHHSLPDNPDSLKLDVGINGWDYNPLSFEEIEIKMKTKNFKPLDHHK